ncbi:MAG: hypothetical protein ABI114_17645 [Rhodanobacter sp.]
MESTHENQPEERPPCVFVLGAKDPEMRLIEEVLESLSFSILKATKNGKRVYPGNAYKADAPNLAAYNYSTLYIVECGWQDEPTHAIHIDHHHPGDPGYGKPPTQYFSASSIGQLFAVISQLLIHENRRDELDQMTRRYDRIAHLVAAADHCLGAAYQGECPGIDAHELMDWCVQQRAAFQKRPVEEVIAELRHSQAVIRQLAVDGLADLRSLPGGTVPAAPEAACREGVAVLTTVIDRDGRQKVGLLGATKDQVTQFLSGQLVTELVDYYGDPARGFAGGYVPTREE